MEKYSSLQDEECLVEILDSWLRNHTGKPSWREIAKALEEVQLHDLAEDVLRSYETGINYYYKSLCIDLSIILPSVIIIN